MSATIIIPPIAAEIAAAIEERAKYPGSGTVEGGLGATLRLLVSDYAQALTSSADALEGADPDEWGEPGDDGLWINLRRTEALRLRELVIEAAEQAAARCEAVIRDELVAAGLAFAAEFPEAPRAKAAVR